MTVRDAKISKELSIGFDTKLSNFDSWLYNLNVYVSLGNCLAFMCLLPLFKMVMVKYLS